MTNWFYLEIKDIRVQLKWESLIRDKTRKFIDISSVLCAMWHSLGHMAHMLARWCFFVHGVLSVSLLLKHFHPSPPSVIGRGEIVRLLKIQYLRYQLGFSLTKRSIIKLALWLAAADQLSDGTFFKIQPCCYFNLLNTFESERKSTSTIFK